MVWLPMLHRSARFWAATVFIAIAVADLGRLSSAHETDKDRPADAVVLPDFAKNVRVPVDGQLVSLDKAVRQKASDPQQKLYRDLRAANAGTAAGQLELARWCRKHGMQEEERLHWWILLGMQPGHPEAIKGLGLRRFQGLLLTSDEIAQLKEQKKEAEESARKWIPELKKLKRAIEHGNADEGEAAIRELKAIRDPHALPLIEKDFGFDDLRIGIQLVEMAKNMEADDGAVFLARLAVNSSDEYVRKNAAEALKGRPYSTYVPTLIAGLAAPVELSFNVKVDPGGPIYQRVNWYEYTGRLNVGMYNKIRLSGNYTNADVAFWVPDAVRKSGFMMTDFVLDRVQYNYLLSRDSPDPDKAV